MLFQGTPEMNSDFACSSTCSRELKGQMEKQTKSSEHKGTPKVIKNAEGKDDANLIREIDIETQGGQELAPSISNNADRKAERSMVGNTAKDDTKMLDHQRKMNKASLKGILTFPGAVDDKPYDLIESTTNNEITNSGNKITYSRGKLNLKASRTEKKLEEQNSNKQKNDNSELQTEVRRKVDKDFGSYSSGQKRRNGQISEAADDIESNSSPHKEKTMEGKDQISGGQKKPKSQINFRSSGEFSKDNISGSSSAALKERKKNSHARTDHAEKKSNAPKSHKQSSGASFREFHGNIKWDNKSEPLENEVGSQDFHSKHKGKSMKPKHEKSVVSIDTFKEKSGCKKVEGTLTSGTFIDEPIVTPLTCNVLATDATVAPPMPAIINDEWVSMKAFEETGIGGYSTEGIATNQPKQRKLAMPKDLKCDSKVNSAASSKMLRGEVQFNASYVDKSNNLDLSAKKRKVKKWQEREPNQEALVTSQHVVENQVIVKGALSESKPVKDRKALLSMPEGEGSKATKLNMKMDQKGKLTRMALPASIEHLPNGINGEALYMMVEEHRSNQSQGNSASPRNLEFKHLKGDMVHAQPPAAANSSSSKVSGSRKSRSNLKETKGSPFESVSSSPSRIPSIEKPSCKRILEQNVDVGSAGFSVSRSPKRCADSEVNGGSARSGNDRKEGVLSLQHRGWKSDLVKSKLRISGSCKEMNLQSTKNSIRCRLEDSFGPCESEKGNTQEKDEKDILRKKDLTSKWMTVRQDNISTLTVQENMDANGTSQNKKALNHPCSDRITCGELPSKLGRSKLKLTSGNKQEKRSWGPPLVSSPLKASKTALQVVDAVSASALKFVKQHKQPDIRNGLHHNNLRHAAHDGPDPSSPRRKENHSVMLKEARDLKHTANRLKVGITPSQITLAIIHYIL
ncbi:hypothetical protein GW17_00002611 [Ensete ventricosum]|nr:hypothetical protein GW17_00002611 [Ensete ventricosum]